MTLADFVKQYREENGLSIRGFAALADLSPQQISNIEAGTNSAGKPLFSTMRTYAKIAAAVGMTEQDFLNLLNDNVLVNPDETKNMPIVEVDGHMMLDLSQVSDEQRELIILTLQLSQDQQASALSRIKSLESQQKAQDAGQ